MASRSSNRIQVWIVALYAVIGLLLIPLFRFQINTDGVSYLSIAQKYLHGDIRDAINGWWGPAISWLLAPILAVVPDGLLASRILSWLIGLFVLLMILRASRCLEMTPWVQACLGFAVIPIVLYQSNIQLTPDLLVAGALIFYVVAIFDGRYLDSFGRSVSAGAAGGLAYLVKTYALPFILVHLTVATLIHLRSRGRPALTKAVVTFLTLAVIAGLWITALSLKYGHLTGGDTGPYAFAFNGPTHPPYPMDAGRLLAPPNPTAVSAWEDPMLAPAPPAWHPFGSAVAFKYFLGLVLSNTGLVLRYVHDFTVFASLITIGFAVFCYRRRSPGDIQLLAALLIYPSGLIAVHVEPRFFWPLTFFLLLMVGRLATFVKVPRWVLAAVLASFVVLPALHLIRARYTGEEIHEMATALRPLGIHGAVASNGYWNQTLFLSYEMGWRYFGYADETQLESVEEQLKTYRTDYFLLWGDGTSPLHNYLVTHFTEVGGFSPSQLEIFKLR